MKVKQKVLKNGGALYVCIPKLIIAAMNLEKGSEIEVQRIEGGFIVTKANEGKEPRNIFD